MIVRARTFVEQIRVPTTPRRLYKHRIDKTEYSFIYSVIQLLEYIAFVGYTMVNHNFTTLLLASRRLQIYDRHAMALINIFLVTNLIIEYYGIYVD